MIQGYVNDVYEAVVPFTLQGPSGQTRDIEAVIDTGYTGFLTLTHALVTELRLSYRNRDLAILADGREAVFDVYGVTVMWDGHVRYVDAYMSDAIPLVGMRLLEGHALNIEVVNGGSVVIEGVA